MSFESQSPSLDLRVLRGLTIGVIGAGTMGQALIGGLLAQGVPTRALRATDASASMRNTVRRCFRIQVGDDNRHVVRTCDVVILAVKPQQFPELMTSIASGVTSSAFVISIAAGITLRWLQARLPKAAVVRVMPNLPATVGAGFSALAMGRRVTARQRQIARALFAAVGETCELPESSFDTITAVSGSGPAYVFYLVQIWQEAARALGLPPTVASRAIAQTLAGSVRLLNASVEPAAVLVSKVASKKGTTEAALKVLAKRRVAAHFAEALKAAARRSRQLSWS
ncbi:MAG: pyrroline-5-carboxylate reductase [Candidatus Omnitrophica bacterium]|nr:pyrroline-5-carboxylate reductase [Candidatus Omnitrophota bacterium]